METLSDVEAVQRLLLALLAGAACGLERERLDKPAGLRTYILVCEGSALFMIASLMLGDDVRRAGGFGYDPSRIGSTIVQGVGFLAAGVIIVSGNRIVGMTTAAGIWVTSAIGLLIGAGHFGIAAVGTFATLFVMICVRWFEHRFFVRSPRNQLLQPNLPEPYEVIGSSLLPTEGGRAVPPPRV
jgi:putative Mg2+ transporter-C (MgtC) family protein